MLHQILLFMGSLGGWEIFLILTVVLLLFGAKKIPDLARGLGQGIREFKDATKEIKHNIEDAGRERPVPPAPPAPPRADQNPPITDSTPRS